MKTIYNVKSKQFDNKQATILTVETNAGNFEVFFSYWTPQVVEFPNGKKYNLTFEGSRFAGSVTTSRTTSKQKTAYY